jgi:hypothetical protein
MPIHFKGQFTPIGKIKIRRLNFEDWWLVAETEERFEDRGLVTDEVGESEEWGLLPKAPTIT